MGAKGEVMRYLSLLVLLAACGKSDEQILREKTDCLRETVGEQINYFAYEQCLWLRYQWTQDAANNAATDLAVMNAKYRTDSLRQANIKRKRK